MTRQPVTSRCSHEQLVERAKVALAEQKLAIQRALEALGETKAAIQQLEERRRSPSRYSDVA